MNRSTFHARSQRLLRLTAVLLAAFLLMGAALLFWSVWRAPAILARDDNPRLIEAERRIQRGQILDQHGAILATNVGPADNLRRFYPLPAGSHAVGFSSLQYGTDGAEEGFDAHLRGDSNDYWANFWRRQLHLPQIGQDVRLTLDADLQAAAVELLNGRTGALLVLETCPNQATCTPKIRAMTSQPGYDANRIDDQFEQLGVDPGAPLLNRAAQGQYQPGLLLQPLILSAALDQGLITLNDPASDPNREVQVGDTPTRCTTPPPDPAVWADVLRHQCPGPMQALADRLGKAGLDKIFNDFGLLNDPPLPIRTQTIRDEPLADPLLAGIGQDNLTVTPLQIGLAMSALGGNGRIAPPQLATEISHSKGKWQSFDYCKMTAVDCDLYNQNTNISASSARAIQNVLAQNGEGHEFSAPVLSGPQGSINSWYIGWLTDAVIVIVLEGNENVAEVEEIGREVSLLAQNQPAN